MSSQDTMNSAKTEEENGKIVQNEINKMQANIAELQKSVASKNQVLKGLHKQESTEVVQNEIDKLQADISALQSDIESNNQVISGLQTKASEHFDRSQKLTKQAADEQQQELEERQREIENEQDSLKKKAVKEAAKESIERGFFG